MRTSPERASSGLALLAAALAVLIVSRSWTGPAPGFHRIASAMPSGVEAAALACCLSGLTAVLISQGLFRRERAHRHRVQARLDRLLASVDHVDSLVAIVNRRGVIEYVNRAVEVQTGYDRGDLLLGRKARRFPWHAERRVSDALWSTVLGGGAFRGRVECARKDGSPFLLETSVVALDEGGRRPARYVATARDVTRQKQLEDQVAFLSTTDPLTGVATRGQFVQAVQSELAESPSRSTAVDVMVLNVDRFKYLNGVHSAELGDETLRRVAGVLRTCVGSEGVIGRLGSDELGVMHRRPREAAPTQMALSIRRAVGQSLDATRHPQVTVTIGVASYPRDAGDAASLIRHADIAHARAKSMGRGSIQVFGTDIPELVLDQYAMQQHLAFALARGEYDVHYQPYCDLSTGAFAGAEALIRWNRGSLGTVAPVKFIPALEDSGLILGVGEWVLRTACRQINDWRNGRRSLPVAVNVSQCEFVQQDLVRMVSDVVQGHGIAPRLLVLELTESMCARDEAFAVEQLERLKSVGVSISIDDFGTGYSSLSYIKKLPVDTLKIDKSFVNDVTNDPDAASIVTAITQMARSLGLKTIAEGVESQEQRNVLRLLRCDMGQGYHFSPPVAAETFQELVAE